MMLMMITNLQALDQQLRQRETALTSAEHRVELLRTRLENDASTTQKAAQAVEAERLDLKVMNLPGKHETHQPAVLKSTANY